ncbi:MAG: DUF433 domain-containing protein [Aridibacter sp.]
MSDYKMIETTQKVPLTVWKDGSIRVKGTRLLIDMIINAHKNGECPEEIFESFPSNVYTVADIYSIVAYYLKNKERFEKYLAKREKEAIEIKKSIEATANYDENRQQLIEKLSKIKQEKDI